MVQERMVFLLHQQNWSGVLSELKTIWMARYLCGHTSVAPDLLRRCQRDAILQPENLVYNTCVAKLRAGEQIVRCSWMHCFRKMRHDTDELVLGITVQILK